MINIYKFDSLNIINLIFHQITTEISTFEKRIYSISTFNQNVFKISNNAKNNNMSNH